MGYDYTAYYRKLSHKERRTELDALYTWSNDARDYRVLKSTIKNNTYYAAVEVYHHSTQAREVFAVVAILAQCTENGVIWYGKKSMDETMGPYYFDCPVAILDLLTPTENQRALEWRARCRENAKRPQIARLPEGTVIRFKSRFDTTSGIKAGDVVTLEKVARSRVYDARTGKTRTSYCWLSKGYYRWTTKMIPRDFEIVTA